MDLHGLYIYTYFMCSVSKLVSPAVSETWEECHPQCHDALRATANPGLTFHDLKIFKAALSYSFGPLPVISTYNPIYRMYNPIYNQL